MRIVYASGQFSPRQLTPRWRCAVVPFAFRLQHLGHSVQGVSPKATGGLKVPDQGFDELRPAAAWVTRLALSR